MNTAGEGGDFNSRMARGTIVAIVVAFVPATVLVLTDPTNPVLAAVAWLGATALLVAAQIATAIYAAVRSPDERDDERDRLIRLRASAPSGGVLGVGVLAAVGTLLAQQFAVGIGIEPGVWGHPMVVAHGLMVALVVAEVVELGSVIAAYKAGG